MGSVQPWVWAMIAVGLVAIVVGLIVAIRARPEPDRGDPSTAALNDTTADAESSVSSDGSLGQHGFTADAETFDQPEAPSGRMARLRARLAGSSTGLGKALLSVLSRDHLGQDDWDELEESLLLADVGTGATATILERLRTRLRVTGESAVDPVVALRQELVRALEIGASRDLGIHGNDGLPGVILVVGVNGSGKTTTIGRLARLLVAQNLTVLLGAADTFRAAAGEQLATWASRVGVEVISAEEGADPASVTFETVKEGIERGIDCVIIDTAGRLQNKANLMDELGKIVRVTAKQAPITEVLLVLDATTGQNGLAQGRVFAEVAEVTGLVLTKLDGSAKGGIVIAVQNDLGVPVKLVGLGEGPDDLAPFDPEVFAEGILS